MLHVSCCTMYTYHQYSVSMFCSVKDSQMSDIKVSVVLLCKSASKSTNKDSSVSLQLSWNLWTLRLSTLYVIIIIIVQNDSITIRTLTREHLSALQNTDVTQ